MKAQRRRRPCGHPRPRPSGARVPPRSGREIFAPHGQVLAAPQTARPREKKIKRPPHRALWGSPGESLCAPCRAARVGAGRGREALGSVGVGRICQDAGGSAGKAPPGPAPSAPAALARTFISRRSSRRQHGSAAPAGERCPAGPGTAGGVSGVPGGRSGLGAAAVGILSRGAGAEDGLSLRFPSRSEAVGAAAAGGGSPRWWGGRFAPI